MRLFDMTDPLMGRLVDGRYQILERLGHGGMGAVYRVREEPLGTISAMKILSPKLASDPIQRARFFRESRVAQRIDHENIIKISEIGETADGIIFMVMEYLRGPTLVDIIPEKGLSLLRTLKIGLQIARGLGRAHDLGIIHRDIKPENVMYASKKGERLRIKLLDFGLAWIKGGPKLTATGQVFGTPEYVSPEQAVGDPATTSSDLYSVGVLLYEMSCGLAPFRGSATEVMLSHINRAPEPPSTHETNDVIPPEFDNLVLKLLEKKPENRYRDAHHLVEDLTGLVKTLEGEDISSVLRKASWKPQHDTGSGSLLPVQNSAIDVALGRWSAIHERYLQIEPVQRPVWLDPCIKKLSGLVSEAEELSQTLMNVSHHRREREQDVRSARERLGRAVDMIAQDESRIRREIEISKKQLVAIELGIQTARIHREEPSVELTNRERQLRQDIRDKESRLDDLRFQLDQLRGRLGAVSATYEHDIDLETSEARSRAGRLEMLLKDIDKSATRAERFLEIYKNISR